LKRMSDGYVPKFQNNMLPLTQVWSLFATGCGGALGGGFSNMFVRTNVSAWNREKIMYGKSATAELPHHHQSSQ
jgi:hypothetical protein